MNPIKNRELYRSAVMNQLVRNLWYYVVCMVPFLSKQRSDAALDVLLPIFRGNSIANDRELDHIESEISRYRSWIKQLRPLDRRAYSGWLSHLSRNVKQRRAELIEARKRAAFRARGSFPIPK